MDILYALITAFAATGLTVPLARRLAFACGAVVQPSPGRPHLRPTPQLGGVAIALGFFAAVLLFACDPKWLGGGVLYPLLLGAGAMVLVGLADDAFVMSPRTKLVCQVCATAILALRGPRFDLFAAPVNLALTWLWLLAVTNAVNFVDGVDGLASGIGVLSGAAVAAIAALHGHTLLAAWAAALAGSLGAFLLFNFSPGSIFMGDSGALAAGVILAALSIAVSHTGEGSWPTRLVLPVLLLMQPLLDLGTVTVTRLATGKEVSRRGLDHSHHRLLRLGLSDRAVCGVMYAVQGAAALCAVGMSLLPGYTAVIFVPFLASGFGLFGLFLMDRSFDVKAPGELRGLPLPARLILDLGYKRRLAEAAMDAAIICSAYFAAVLFRHDFQLTAERVTLLLETALGVVPIAYGAFWLCGIYRGIWRYTGLHDAGRFGAASALAALAAAAASRLAPLYLSDSIAVLYAILLFNFMLAARFSFRIFARVARGIARADGRTLVVGAGDSAEAAARLLERGGNAVRLLGFLDDDEFKRGKMIHGCPVLGSIGDLEQVFRDTPFDEILLAHERLAILQLRLIRRFAQSHALSLRRFTIATSSIYEPAGSGGSLDEASGASARRMNRGARVGPARVKR